MSELSEFRKAKDKFFGHDHQSPLTPDQRKKFDGLAYYTEKPSLAFAVEINEFADEAKEVIEMATSTGDSASHVRWGEFGFEVEGAAATLVVYRGLNSEDFFLPFLDWTSGEATYSGGRYLELIELGDGRTLADFNYAYNPYCAYNPHWSCPIPPPENRLTVPIEAGEKAFPGPIDSH
jgi:uncharacterized protein (DUF1684 family)